MKYYEIRNKKNVAVYARVSEEYIEKNLTKKIERFGWTLKELRPSRETPYNYYREPEKWNTSKDPWVC